MTARIIDPALWDDTRKQRDGAGPIRTGDQRIAILEVDGVQFRSWLPRSAEECARINTAAEEIVRRVQIPAI